MPHEHRSPSGRGLRPERGLTAETVAKRLSTAATKTSGQWQTVCPAHNDSRPSLTIRDRSDGGLNVHCKAGCSQQAVIDALAQLSISVFPPRENSSGATGNIASLLTKGFRVVKAYPYTDEAGHLLYENVRLEIGHNGTREKTFRQRRPNGRGGYIENLNEVRRVPYRLAQLAAQPDQDVHVTEGEKDTDRLAALGLLSTSIATPTNCDVEVFRGRNVYVHEDNDKAGREKSAKLASALADIAATITIVRYPDAGDGGDVSDWLDKGHDLQALLTRCEEALATKGRGAAAALEFDDQITVETSVNDLVKGVIHPGDVGALYGISGAGKTFVGIDLGYHIALGRSWNGRRVRQAPVLYVGLEGVRGLRHRMKAYAQQMGSAGRMLARQTVHTPLDKSEVGTAGERAIIEHAKALSDAAGKPVGLIIIDTLARAIAGDDENSAQDMAAFVGRLHAIAQETGAAVLVVHHPGKDEARGMRGSTALFAACDTVIKITASGNVREVATEKVKDGVIGPLLSYTLKQVSLGTDDDGDEITSCIVEAVTRLDQKVQRPRPESPAGKALNELEQMIIAGIRVPARGHPRAPDGAMLVTRAAWRNACRQRSLSDGTPENEKKAFQRAVANLSAANLVSDFGEVVWPIVKRSRDIRME